MQVATNFHMPAQGTFVRLEACRPRFAQKKLKKKHSFDKVLHVIKNIRQLLLYTQALITCRDQARTELVDKLGTSRGFYSWNGCKWEPSWRMISDANLQTMLLKDIPRRRSPYQQDSFLASSRTVLMSFQKPCCLNSWLIEAVMTARMRLGVSSTACRKKAKNWLIA